VKAKVEVCSPKLQGSTLLWSRITVRGVLV